MPIPVPGIMPGIIPGIIPGVMPMPMPMPMPIGPIIGGPNIGGLCPINGGGRGIIIGAIGGKGGPL
jgi:hypothetical protein